MPRAGRVGLGLICLLVPLYWLGVIATDSGSGGSRVLLVILALGALTMVPAALARSRLSGIVQTLACGVGMFTIVGAILLNQWIRGDFDRYAWVIRQPAPCTYMGSGPGSLWLLATATVFAIAATTWAFAGGLSRQQLLAALAVATALSAATAVAMFPDPTVFAAILGCV